MLNGDVFSLGHLHSVHTYKINIYQRVFSRANFIDQNDVPISWGRREIRQKGRGTIARVCLNLNFEFRDVSAPGKTPGDGPGQPSDAVFGLAVLQFLNRIGRRQIPRDIEDLPRGAYIRIYMYICIRSNGDSIPEL